MYGIINNAIKGMLVDHHGSKVWEKVKAETGIEQEVYLSNESYDDSITYQLAQAASKVLEIPLSEVLISFGAYWIQKTGMEHYGSYMEAGGNDLQEFLINLPNFHSRVMLIFPELKPPEFRVSDISDQGLHLHYYSDRPGLQDFVKGLVFGLAQLYETQVEVELILGRVQGHDHDVFQVNW